jgi:hypothetical protein
LAEEWKGEVVPNADGKIRGCSISQTEGKVTEWTITIDGDDNGADLGPFSKAIYNKIAQDAKQQRFQGFRPGTIPPHLEPTYRAFAMDECARETVLEAMQQNSIRPFQDARAEMVLENFCIPPVQKKGKKRKRKKGAPVSDERIPEEPAWLTGLTMREAVDAGWKPGQSFGFVAREVKGQKVKDETDAKGATPIGPRY